MPVATPRHVRERRQRRISSLRAQGFASYGEYLRSSHWLRLKAEYRESDLPQECICGEIDVHMHHMTYDRIGAEQLTDLTPLCGRCHALVHVLEFRGDIALDLEGLCDEGRALEARGLLTELAAKRQVERERALRERQDRVRSLPFASRLMAAVDHARTNRVDVTRQVHVLRIMVEQGRKQPKLTRQLAVIESKAYGWDEWRF